MAGEWRESDADELREHLDVMASLLANVMDGYLTVEHYDGGYDAYRFRITDLGKARVEAMGRQDG